VTYLVVTIKAVKDREAFRQYADRVKPIIERHGGKYLVIEKEAQLRAGEWPFVRTVIVGFPSLAAARAWYDSPEYSEIIPIRERAIDANIVLVRDLAEAPESP
jgi:uncharacterized protein (DUF1330 family)